MKSDSRNIDNWDDLLVQAEGNKRLNQIEIIELVAQDNHLNNVDYIRSIAVVNQGELYVRIFHSHDQSFIQTYPTDERNTTELLDRAVRLIADKMYDSSKRLRILEQQ